MPLTRLDAWGRIAALAGLVSFACIDLFGTLAAVAFLLSLGAVAAYLIAVGRFPLQRLPFILLIPAVYLLISPASENLPATLRADTQLALTLMFPALAASVVNGRTFLTVTGATLFAVLPIHILFGQTGGNWQGILASKNVFAFYMSATSLYALYFMFAWPDRRSLQWLGLCILPVSAFALFKANSAGAIVSMAPVVALFVGWLSFGRLPRVVLFPVVTFAVVAIIVVAALVIVEYDALFDLILRVFSKDAGLSGRDYLWFRGWQYISESPWVGHGYAAFWSQGNVEAEGLWRWGGIGSRTGFNFHNIYIHNLVDVGIVGFCATVTFVLGTALFTLRTALHKGSAESLFFLSFILLLLIRSYVEVDFPKEFGFFTYTLAAAAAYSLEALRPQRGEAGR